MPQPKKNDGAQLQATLQDALKAYCRYHPAFFFRFYDTKSARNLLPAQPGDFFLLTPSTCFLIECKSTVIGEPILSLAYHGEVGKRQVAEHKLWQRAGHRSLYLYHDGAAKRYEWHDGANIIKRISRPLWAGNKQQLQDSIAGLLEEFNYDSVK
jgi:hypothetical protein